MNILFLITVCMLVEAWLLHVTGLLFLVTEYRFILEKWKTRVESKQRVVFLVQLAIHKFIGTR